MRNPRLNLFAVPPTDLSIGAGRENRINPQTTGLYPISFQVEATTDYINLDESFVELDFTLHKSDGGNIAQGDRWMLANNLAHTLFRQIVVRLNGTLLSPQTDTYHYQAFFDTLLNHNKEDVEDILAPTGFYDCLDVPSRGDGDAPTADQNNPTHADYVALPEDHKRLVNFRVKFLGGNKVTMRFTPSLEVFRLRKLLRPNVQIQMEMYLNDPSVWGIRYAGADTLRISAEEISVKLYIKQIKIDPAVYRTLTASFNGGKIASYPVVRGAVRTYAHPTDNRHFECNNPFNGQVPNRLIVVMMRQTAFNGDYGQSPFTFGKFNLQSIKLVINGEEYPYETLVLDHDGPGKDYKGYHRFLEASGSLARKGGNFLKARDWGHGKKANLFVFDTTANGALDSPVLNPKQTGDVRLVMDFGANPGQNLTIMLYGEFENVIEIKGNGTVTYDVHQ